MKKIIVVVVAGSRSITDYDLVRPLFDRWGYHTKMLIATGGASGVDSLAKRYARKNNVRYGEVRPNWVKYPRRLHGNRAYYERNKLLVLSCDYAVVIWDGESKGSKIVMDLCFEYNKMTTVHILDGDTVITDKF